MWKTALSVCRLAGKNILEAILKEGIAWLNDYFAGEKPELSRLSLAPTGGDFRQQVWNILTEIPYGKLTTYGIRICYGLKKFFMWNSKYTLLIALKSVEYESVHDYTS